MSHRFIPLLLSDFFMVLHFHSANCLTQNSKLKFLRLSFPREPQKNKNKIKMPKIQSSGFLRTLYILVLAVSKLFSEEMYNQRTRSIRSPLLHGAISPSIVYERDFAQSALRSSVWSVCITLYDGSSFLCHPCTTKQTNIRPVNLCSLSIRLIWRIFKLVLLTG